MNKNEDDDNKVAEVIEKDVNKTKARKEDEKAAKVEDVNKIEDGDDDK